MLNRAIEDTMQAQALEKGYRPPIPSVEWEITDFCNYKCEYCCQKQFDPKKARHGHATDQTIDAVFDVLDSLPGEWKVKIQGGEAMIHPRFFDICRRLAESRHKIRMATNFSLPKERISELIGICGSKLEVMSISLHQSQINLGSFIEKVVWFNSAKNEGTRLWVTAVLTEGNFHKLKGIKKVLDAHKINFRYAVLQEDTGFAMYPEEIEREIRGHTLEHTEVLRGKSFFGMKCHSGQFFLLIKPNGDAFRCHEVQPGGYLGNIPQGTFKRFEDSLPCLSTKCLCVAMPARNLIRFGDRESLPALSVYLFRSLLKREIPPKKILGRAILLGKKRLRELVPGGKETALQGQNGGEGLLTVQIKD